MIIHRTPTIDQSCGNRQNNVTERCIFSLVTRLPGRKRIRSSSLLIAMLASMLLTVPIQTRAQYDYRREQERRDQERREQERRDQQRLEMQRLERQRLDQQRETQRLERDRLERQRVDRNREQREYEERQATEKRTQHQQQEKLFQDLWKQRTGPTAGSNPDSPSPGRSGILTVVAPPGWNRADDPARQITMYSPPALPSGGECFLMVTPSFAFNGTADELQIATARRLSAGMQVITESISIGVAGGFRFLSFVQISPDGLPQWWALYTTVWGGRGQTLIYGSNAEQLFHAHAPAVHSIVSRVFVPAS